MYVVRPSLFSVFVGGCCVLAPTMISPLLLLCLGPSVIRARPQYSQPRRNNAKYIPARHCFLIDNVKYTVSGYAPPF